MNSLRDTVIIVTGGAHGIGAAVVQRCSGEGARGGQLALMQQLATDLAPDIRVNAVPPRTIRSCPESWEAEQENNWSGIHALKRIGECVEVANGVVFLASGEASFITGHGLAIDGGLATNGGR